MRRSRLSRMIQKIFLAWILYKAYRILCRFWKIFDRWAEKRRAEKEFIQGWARAIKLDREGDAPWLRSR